MPARRMTSYDSRMTMLSFRVDDEEATAVQRWADELGIDRSALLRDAVRGGRVCVDQDTKSVVYTGPG